MYKGRSVAVVIPAFNVARHIASVVDSMPGLVDHIVIVDDASTDGTLDVIQTLGDPRVVISQHALNQGVGAATVTGFRAALELRAEIVVKMDGDGQMDSQHLPDILNPIVLDNCAYSKGNRFLRADRLREMPRLRLVGSFGLTFLSKLASGYWHLFDPVNGYIAIDAAMLQKLPLDHIARRYFFETDMLIHLNVLKAKVADVPVPARYGDEDSSLRVGLALLTFPLFLLKGFWYRLYERHVLREFSPVAVFWLLGSILLLWGTAFGAFTWVKSGWTGRVATTGTVMLSVLPFIIGFQLALQAILIEIQDSARLTLTRTDQ